MFSFCEHYIQTRAGITKPHRKPSTNKPLSVYTRAAGTNCYLFPNPKLLTEHDQRQAGWAALHPRYSLLAQTLSPPVHTPTDARTRTQTCSQKAKAEKSTFTKGHQLQGEKWSVPMFDAGSPNTPGVSEKAQRLSKVQSGHTGSCCRQRRWSSGINHLSSTSSAGLDASVASSFHPGPKTNLLTPLGMLGEPGASDRAASHLFSALKLHRLNMPYYWCMHPDRPDSISPEPSREIFFPHLQKLRC